MKLGKNVTNGWSLSIIFLMDPGTKVEREYTGSCGFLSISSHNRCNIAPRCKRFIGRNSRLGCLKCQDLEVLRDVI